MIVYALKNASESNEKLILRYKKMFFQTRTANKLRAEKYAERKPSKRRIREKAIVCEMYRSTNKRESV
ncbi:MAG: hypothetical protein QG650_1131 [Patescibacteria group bacterium]|nr:hypothetical protein [Patescibacteria group bacterium]